MDCVPAIIEVHRGSAADAAWPTREPRAERPAHANRTRTVECAVFIPSFRPAQASIRESRVRGTTQQLPDECCFRYSGSGCLPRDADPQPLRTITAQTAPHPEPTCAQQLSDRCVEANLAFKFRQIAIYRLASPIKRTQGSISPLAREIRRSEM